MTELLKLSDNNVPDTENNNNSSGDESAVLGGPLTNKETNACLTATVTHNPYGQPHKKKGDAWKAVMGTVNKDTKHILSTDTIKQEVNKCIKLHTKHIECAGQAACQAALETFVWGANPLPTSNNNPTSSSDHTLSPPCNPNYMTLSGQMSMAIDDANCTEDIWHTELLDALQENSD
ncbi:hypothetical protein RhiXN_03699 [Rhizoctonia solani]|uniref:Myb/SANT-like domain-containing protein n=1 Tax=Rhizoctonia solani TaxID=456999 RepID=A0A8H8NNV9_9AGAM|nr:uncharacterized protein RhiXN_03699 [Rhizoctonia solani]QRW15698.1 hypothetical protein RhiXN_03699 [Rhizoctonia solani]